MRVWFACVCAPCAAWYSQRSEEGTGDPRTELKDGCE